MTTTAEALYERKIHFVEDFVTNLHFISVCKLLMYSVFCYEMIVKPHGYGKYYHNCSSSRPHSCHFFIFCVCHCGYSKMCSL